MIRLLLTFLHKFVPVQNSTMSSYLQKIRSKIGNDKFICPGARILVENEFGEMLTIIRKDTGRVGLPAGSIEEGETIEGCIIREVKEETGIDIHSLHVIGICTNPVTQTVQYPNGDITQYFVIEFYSDDWSGELKTNDPDEVSMVLFGERENLEEQLPRSEVGILDSYDHFQETGSLVLS